MKKTLILCLLLTGLFCLSACGRVSKPQKPKESIYPKEYTVKP